jgi:hypothetical protein
MEERKGSDWLGHVEGMRNETSLQDYQESLIIMNKQLCFYVSICITSYRYNDISIAVTNDQIHSLTLYYTVTTVTLLTFLLWLC